ncbi:HutP [Fusobacterium necrogenes]|uniref:Hut operon positive regulatory protein n=1 Tax=Fusobacterium necrogenes TaxID=858 RepID=A0A377GZB2_9FUSO|nr:HutP family protein [Fusobacterium necrogenes]STO32337.1 HutP [Fusobacterium necrogenes]
MQYKSKDIARISVEMSMSSRDEELELKEKYLKKGIKTAAVDIGGNVVESIPKILERTLVAAKRNGLISESHVYEGAVTGATREAIDQILDKSVGFNVGGKIGIARYHEHLSVCIFLTIGMFRLDEVVIGLGHRAVPIE